MKGSDMKYVGSMFNSILFSLMFFGYAAGHVRLDAPNGGEVFIVGDTLSISWTLEIPHNQKNWDLYFSPDGGVTWDTLKADLPTSQFSYDWIVPDSMTEQAQIQIFMDNEGTDYSANSDNFTIQGAVVSVKDAEEIPRSFELYNNYPNPFNPETTIRYSLPMQSDVKLLIYNLLGQEVFRFEVAGQKIGEYEVVWNGRNQRGNPLSSGLYIYRFSAGEFVQTRKMLLLK